MISGTYVVARRRHGPMMLTLNLLHAGVDIETVRDLMGHADITTTARYLSTTDPRRRAAVATLAGSRDREDTTRQWHAHSLRRGTV